MDKRTGRTVTTKGLRTNPTVVPALWAPRRLNVAALYIFLWPLLIDRDPSVAGCSGFPGECGELALLPVPGSSSLCAKPLTHLPRCSQSPVWVWELSGAVSGANKHRVPLAVEKHLLLLLLRRPRRFHPHRLVTDVLLFHALLCLSTCAPG